MIYFMDNPEHRAELERLAKDGGRSVWVKESSGSLNGPLYLMNLRLSLGGMLAGDAKVAPPETEPPTPVASA